MQKKKRILVKCFIFIIMTIILFGAKEVFADEGEWWIDEGNYNYDWFINDSDYNSNEGDGIYYISTPEELAGLAVITDQDYLDYFQLNIDITRFKNKTIKIINDIDLSENYWCPIPYLEDLTIDGGNNCISGLDILGNVFPADDESIKASGFISLGKNINIKNLNLKGKLDSTQSKYEDDYIYIGGVAGYLIDSTIDNTNVDIDILITKRSADFFVGGIVGYLLGGEFTRHPQTIKNSSNLGEITISYEDYTHSDADVLAWYVGGIAGEINGDKVINSFNLGNINIDLTANKKDYIVVCSAGIVARTGQSNTIGGEYTCIIMNSYNRGDIKVLDGEKIAYIDVAGIATDISSYTTVMNTYNTGKIAIISNENNDNEKYKCGPIISESEYLDEIGVNNCFLDSTDKKYMITLDILNNMEEEQKLLEELKYTNIKLKKWISDDSINDGYPILVDIIKDETDYSNVKIESYDIYVPLNTKLSVKENSNSEFVKKVFGELFEKYISYDINLISGTQKIEPNGEVKVKIKIPENFNSKNLGVYYISEESSTKELDFTIENGDIIFETNHFSTYAIVDKDSEMLESDEESDLNNKDEQGKVEVNSPDNKEEQEKVEENNNINISQGNTNQEEQKTPQTGDSIMIFVIMFLISVFGIIILKNYKKIGNKH